MRLVLPRLFSTVKKEKMKKEDKQGSHSPQGSLGHWTVPESGNLTSLLWSRRPGMLWSLLLFRRLGSTDLGVCSFQERTVLYSACAGWQLSFPTHLHTGFRTHTASNLYGISWVCVWLPPLLQCSVRGQGFRGSGARSSSEAGRDSIYH